MGKSIMNGWRAGRDVEMDGKLRLREAGRPAYDIHLRRGDAPSARVPAGTAELPEPDSAATSMAVSCSLVLHNELLTYSS